MNETLLKYISPGEFTFCSRCGLICRHTAKNFICTRCKSQMFGGTGKKTEEKFLAIAFEQAISDTCMEYRHTLAELRHEEQRIQDTVAV